MAKAHIHLGVEIGKTELKFALVDPKQKKIYRTDALQVSGNPFVDSEIYVSAVSSWLSSGVFPQIDVIAISLPAYLGTIRSITIPSDAPDPLNYAKWELSSTLNSQPDDYIWDVSFYPKPKHPKRAHVSAFHRQYTETFCSQSVQKNNLMPRYWLMDVFAVWNLFEISEGVSTIKCLLKADKDCVTIIWGDASGPLTLRVIPQEVVSPGAVSEMLQSGFEEFPKAKRLVKFCGELAESLEFCEELEKQCASMQPIIKISIWNELSKFTKEKGGNFLHYLQCMGAIGVTLNCGTN